MKYDFGLLKADILKELDNIKIVEAEFTKIEDMLRLPAERVSFYDRGAIGYILHNFYNGCENIFGSIARFFENDVGPQSWHKDLLRRVNLEIPGIRPRLIDDELYRLLDDFRAFRHKFRYLYSFELDWEKECIVARKFPVTIKKFKMHVAAFLKKLEEAGESEKFSLDKRLSRTTREG
jgi:hypothetical protein